MEESLVKVLTDNLGLEGNLSVPEGAKSIIVFAHGSGSGRNSPRNRYVAGTLNKHKFATLLFDLLTPKEEEADRYTGHIRFNIPLLSRRLTGATDWLAKNPQTRGLRVCYFGASTGAAATLISAAERPTVVRAIVSRGGRPDLAEEKLALVNAPVLLIVGENDPEVIRLNRQAAEKLGGKKEITIVPGASHLFEEPGTLEKVAQLAADWFLKYG